MKRPNEIVKSLFEKLKQSILKIQFKVKSLGTGEYSNKTIDIDVVWESCADLIAFTDNHLSPVKKNQNKKEIEALKNINNDIERIDKFFFRKMFVDLEEVSQQSLEIGIKDFVEIFPDSTERIQNWFENYRQLPFQYSIKVPITSEIYTTLEEYWNENQEIIPGFRLEKSPASNENNFLHINFIGYILSLNNNNEVGLLNSLKSFFGLFIVLGFFNYSNRFSFRKFGLAGGITEPIKLFNQTTQEDKEKSLPLPESIKVFLRNIEKEQDLSKQSFRKEILYGFSPNNPEIEKVKESYRENFKNGMNKFFTSNENTKNKKRLLIACKWFFDCISTESELESFLYGSFALEAILGENLKDPDKKDPDKEELYKVPLSITKTLRERVSFLLGRDTADRERLSNLVNNLYSTRSMIAHGSITMLNPQRSQQLSDLQDICKRAIQKIALQDFGYAS